MAADVVNLNRARKAQARAEKERRAAENRVRFGQPKLERAKRSAEKKRATRDLDSKKIGDGDGGDGGPA